MLNDVCPHGQVMTASPRDVHCVNDVVPSAQWANITSLRAFASNIIMCSIASLLRQQKHH